VIVGVGVDLFEVARMERDLRSGGSDLREQLFTSGEIAYCEAKRRPARHYAARFAAKEALLKALGADGRGGWTWREAEIRSDGAVPQAVLHGTLKARATALHVQRVLLSLSHTRGLAMASVVLES
jgi:holo-[acyl-carrier protein] synthase